MSCLLVHQTKNHLRREGELLFYKKNISQPANIGSQNIWRMFPTNITRTSPRDLIWSNDPRSLIPGPGDVPVWCPGDVLQWRPWDVLIWRSRDVPGRLIRYIPRTFSGRPLENLQIAQTWMSQNFLLLFFQNLFDCSNLSKSISTLKVYWESNF